MKNILITGGSGLVGHQITQILEKNGFQVAWLSRSPQTQKSFIWDVDNQHIDQNAIEWADAIIHLAGTGVAEKRWTPRRKRDILESRTESTHLLFEAIKKANQKPKAFISASAVGYYGFDTGQNLKEEEAKPGNDFLANVVIAWESEVQKIATLGVRTAILRIGIVLDQKGGALGEMLKPPVAAALGTGDQWMSWIHIQDLARLFVFALEHATIEGIYNAVAPNPVTNRELTKQAAKAKGKPYIGIGVPAFVLKLALGQMAAMVLGGNRVSCEKILKSGFEFHFEQLQPALQDLFKN
jgi:uncharacterized protein (TIGR01777 family)